MDISGIQLVFAALLVWVGVSDVQSLRIPNAAVLALLGLFGLAVVAAGFPEGWAWRLALGGGALALGMVLFAFNVAGAGDGKLLAVVALWAGPSHCVHLLALTALLGLALLPIKLGANMALTQIQLLVPQTAHWSLPKGVVQAKAVPYGVAIAGATLATSTLYPEWLWAF